PSKAGKALLETSAPSVFPTIIVSCGSVIERPACQNPVIRVHIGTGVFMRARLFLAAILISGVAWAAQPKHHAAKAPTFITKDGQIAWMHDEAQALAQAKALNRPVLLDFYAEWCHSCKELDNRTYTDPRVRDAVASKFVPLKVDCTDHTEEV